MRVRVLEDHWYNQEGEILEFIGYGEDEETKGFLGEHIRVKDNWGQTRFVDADLFEWFHGEEERELPKEDGIIRITAKIKGLNNPFYRVYRIEDNKVVFFDEKGHRNKLSMDLVEVASIDSLFDAVSHLAVKVREQDQFLEKLFNMEDLKKLYNN